MTALNFVITRNEICFAVDTLAIGADDHQPFAYITKFVLLPHIKTAATGTGHGMFLAEWYAHVRGSIIASDIDRLDGLTPAELRRIARGYDLAAVSATVYHFGYSELRERFLGYAYRSTTNFASEEFGEGTGIKPEVKLPPEPHVYPALFVDLMKRQREDDLARPVRERIGIGGEVQCIHMQRSGTSVTTLHRFDSYEADLAAMCARLPAGSGSEPSPRPTQNRSRPGDPAGQRSSADWTAPG